MSSMTQKPIAAEWLCRCIGQALDDNAIVVEEAVTNCASVLRQVCRTKQGTFLSSQGHSLGWALGAALGASLARPRSIVAALVGDGSFIFGHPIPALWAAKAYHAPFLCIILNNGRYNAVRAATEAAFGKESFAQKTGHWVGVNIEPSPEYAQIAQACGAYGERIEDPQDIENALGRAIEQVRGGKAAVLDVKIA